jgi:hypothetical protein
LEELMKCSKRLVAGRKAPVVLSFYVYSFAFMSAASSIPAQLVTPSTTPIALRDVSIDPMLALHDSSLNTRLEFAAHHSLRGPTTTAFVFCARLCPRLVGAVERIIRS